MLQWITSSQVLFKVTFDSDAVHRLRWQWVIRVVTHFGLLKI
jgi:hypothetical protein